MVEESKSPAVEGSEAPADRSSAMGGGTIRHFTEIKAWQFGREAIKDVYRLTSAPKFGRDFGLRDQTRRAAVSINLNIAEGFARGTDREFHQFVIQARGSAAELASALYTALDLEYIAQQDFDMLAAKVDSLSRMLTNLAKYLSSPVRGRRSADPSTL